MRCFIGLLCTLSVLFAISHAAPANVGLSVSASGSQEASSDPTAVLTRLSDQFTMKIQLLRRLCPPLFQVIDNVVQNVTSQIFRVVGRVVLRSGLGGSIGGGGENRVSVVLPTFPPDEEEEEDDSTEPIEVSSRASIESASLDPGYVRISSSNTKPDPVDLPLRINEIEPSKESDTDGTLYTSIDIGGRLGEEITENLNAVSETSTQITTTSDQRTINPNAERIDIRGRLGEENMENLSVIPTDAANVNVEENTENVVFTSAPYIANKEETTALNLESTTTSRTDVDTEIREKSIDAIFKGLVEIENEVDSPKNATDANTEKEDTKPAKEGGVDFNIKVLHDGDVVNTIPIVGSTEKRENVLQKRSPSSDLRAKRVAREAEESENDQEPAASGGNGPDPADDLSDVDEGDRDKRYSPFGGDASHSGGGSGNFLFDIIRQTADGAARAAGTIYRMVAGTENLGIGLSATSTATRVVDTAPQLIAGSGATEESDEQEHGAVGSGGVAEIDVAKTADGYTEGIPGPITRLFVIANRGLANLVQDLILRLAQTSERIVNFKARLITALI